MKASINNIIEGLNGISEISNSDELKLLDNLVQNLAEVEHPELAIESLLQIFERFPEEDGSGVFWSILHALESFAGYESFLLASLKRKPTEFTVIMANRIMNDGQLKIDGVYINSLLQSISDTSSNSKRIRELADRFIEYQKNKA